MIPSVILINGSFGVGKTSVARELARRVRGSTIYDPEWAGWVIQRLPAWARLRGRGTDDFQDVELWRASVVAGTRAFRALFRGPVLVPMTFSRLDYLEQVLAGIRSFEPDVRIFCLVASLATIRKRIRDRGAVVEGPAASWILRRTAECVDAHRDARFGEPLDAEARSAADIAQALLSALRKTA